MDCGMPGSPPNTIDRGLSGARTDCTPGSKPEVKPAVSRGCCDGSQRSPRLSVSRLDTFQSSWIHGSKVVMTKFHGSALACEKVEGSPSRKLPTASPDFGTLADVVRAAEKVHAPASFALWLNV